MALRWNMQEGLAIKTRVNLDKEMKKRISVESRQMLKGIRHLFHAAVRIERDSVIYIDPLRIEGAPHDADLVFCTHDRFDHFSPEDIGKVKKEKGTVLVVPERNTNKCKKLNVSDVIGVEPNKSYEAVGIKFKTTPSYNNSEQEYHKMNKKGVGYIVELEGTSYYFVGDLIDYVPEMDDIKADVVFLPVGGIYSMDAIEAANVANVIKPRIAIPIHFGDLIGIKEDAEIFIRNLSDGITGVILR